MANIYVKHILPDGTEDPIHTDTLIEVDDYEELEENERGEALGSAVSSWIMNDGIDLKVGSQIHIVKE